MPDTNQLVQEQEALINEAKQIANEADAEIKAIQERPEIVSANAEIEAINKKANEKLEPKNKRIAEITAECMKELRVQNGLTNE